MPEEEHEKKLTPKHYTTMLVKTSRTGLKRLPQATLQPSIDELVVPLVVRAHHFLACEASVWKGRERGFWAREEGGRETPARKPLFF